MRLFATHYLNLLSYFQLLLRMDITDNLAFKIIKTLPLLDQPK
jgi:hypothetical protein